MSRARRIGRLVVLVALAILLLYLYRTHAGVERTPTPVCSVDNCTEAAVYFSSDAVSGFAIRVESYLYGGDLFSETVSFWPCWWSERDGQSYPHCLCDFAVQRYTPDPDIYAWSAAVAFYRDNGATTEIGTYEPCADYVNCNQHDCAPGERDTYMAWPDVMVMP